MANRFWVGGTASWDGTAATKWATVSGGAGGAAVPTTADDVFFDAASGAVTVTIAAGNTGCQNLTCTGFTGTLTGAASLDVAGSFTLAAGMTYSFVSTLNFIATATGKTITTAGKTIFGQVIFNGAGGGWTLQDNFTASNQLISLLQGTLDMNGKTVAAGAISSSGAGTRTLTLGAASLTLSIGGTGFRFIDFSGANFTFNANTSTITGIGSRASFRGGGKTFNNVVINTSSAADGLFDDANTFANLTYTGGTLSGLQFNANQTITGTLTLTGSSVSARPLFQSDTIGTARTLTAAVVALTDVDFTDITGAGAGSPFTGTRIGDCKGNSGITFTAPANKFWVNDATVAWNAANSWATTTGGAGATNNFPLPQDTCIFDANSFSANGRTISDDSGFRKGSINLAALDQTMTLSMSSSTGSYFGDITLGANVTMSGNAVMEFRGRGTQTITSAGKSFTQAFVIDSLGGTVQPGDAFTTSNTTTLTRGTLDWNGQTWSTNDFSSISVNVREIKSTPAGGKIVTTSTGTGVVWNVSGSLTVTRNSWSIEIGGNTSNTRTFSGGGRTYPALTFTNTTPGGRLDITGSNTFKSLSVSNPPQSVMFAAASTNTIEDANGFPAGSAGNLVTIGSITAANHNLAKSGAGLIETHHLSISRSQASPADKWYAGSTSTDGGNNTGWRFRDAPDKDAFMAFFGS